MPNTALFLREARRADAFCLEKMRRRCRSEVESVFFFLRLETEKPLLKGLFCAHIAYHLGEGRVLKTNGAISDYGGGAYHLGEGRVLKTIEPAMFAVLTAYHLGEGRVLKTKTQTQALPDRAYHLGEGRVLKTLRFW